MWFSLNSYCIGHAVVHYNGTILAISGVRGQNLWGTPKFGEFLESCELFNEVENKWVISASLNECRYDFGATVVGDFVYVVGGDHVDSIERFDGILWIKITTLDTDAFHHSAVTFDDSIMIVDHLIPNITEYNTTTRKITLNGPATGHTLAASIVAVSF